MVGVVVGIISSTRRRPELLNAVAIAPAAADMYFGIRQPDLLQVENDLGANDLVRRQVPLLLAPNAPTGLAAVSPPLPADVRASVSGDVQALLIALGGVSLVVGALGIANVTLVSVIERTAEIGMRRALGGLRRHVVVQILAESTILGFVGGILGTSLGIVVVVGTSVAKHWHPVLSPSVAIAAPIVGAMVGLLSGAFPASRAGTIEPAAALRSGL